jgi:hypothetical protein
MTNLNLVLIAIAILLGYGAVSTSITLIRRDLHHVVITATPNNYYFILSPETFILFSSENQSDANALAQDISICVERKRN